MSQNSNVSTQLRKITYTVTSNNPDGKIVIPLFTCSDFLVIHKTKDGFNGEVKTDLLGEDETFADVLDTGSNNVIHLGSPSAIDPVSAGTGVVNTGTNRAKYPFQLRSIVVTAPTSGKCIITIIYTE